MSSELKYDKDNFLNILENNKKEFLELISDNFYKVLKNNEEQVMGNLVNGFSKVLEDKIYFKEIIEKDENNLLKDDSNIEKTKNIKTSQEMEDFNRSKNNLLDSLKDENKYLKENLDNLKKMIKELEKEKELQDSRENFEIELKEKINLLENDVKVLKSENNVLITSNESLNLKNQTLDEEILKFDDIIKALNFEKQDLEKNIHELNIKLSTQKEEFRVHANKYIKQIQTKYDTKILKLKFQLKEEMVNSLSLESNFKVQRETALDLEEKVETLYVLNENLTEQTNVLKKLLESTKEELGSEISKLEFKFKDEKIKSLDLELELDNSRERISILEEEFSEEKKIYNKYLNLSNDAKEELKQIFRNTGIKPFLSTISQYSNIELIWDYMKKCVMESNLKDLNSLEIILEFAFKKYNEIYDNPLYVMQEVKLDDVFDEKQHFKSPNSGIEEIIKKVYLQGYIDINLNEVVKKSVVQV